MKIPNLVLQIRSFYYVLFILGLKINSCFILCLLPDFYTELLKPEQEETLVQYDLGEHSFESNSSVQMPTRPRPRIVKALFPWGLNNSI